MRMLPLYWIQKDFYSTNVIFLIDNLQPPAALEKKIGLFLQSFWVKNKNKID